MSAENAVAAEAAVTRMPALYLSHGAPPLADHATWPDELAAWSRNLPLPKDDMHRVGVSG